MAEPTIEGLLAEGRRFPPPETFKKDALVVGTDLYDDADRDYEGFWARQAVALDWSKEWDTILDWDLPFAKWFVGGELNASQNCIDRHVDSGHGSQVAYHWEGEPGDTRTITYSELLDEVSRLANALKELGVGKGDRVAIYLGMVPELPMAMLACARIGAAHSVVFGGFSKDSLRDRINDAECTVLVTGDGAWRRGNVVPLKATADDAVAETPSIQKVLVVRRTENDVTMQEGRDVWYHDLVPQPERRVRARGDGFRRPPVHPLHERDDRKAQGDHAHDGWLPHPGRVHPQARVRPAPRHRRLLVRG